MFGDSHYFYRQKNQTMRLFLIFSFLFIAITANAQKSEPRLLLNKGQKLTVKTSSSQDADMGMGMEMKNPISSSYNLVVLDANKENYTVSNTLTGLKLSVDFMGQSTNYDSDKKEDADSELGKSVKNLNVPDTLIISKNTATVTYNKKVDTTTTDSSNPFESMFESLSNNDSRIADELFLVIPSGIKNGDKWYDSSSTESIKSIKEYELQSVENGIATIKTLFKVDNNSQVELQGMQVTISMSTQSTGTIIADTKTSIVSKRTAKAQINGSLELMGQTMNVTGSSTSTTTVE